MNHWIQGCWNFAFLRFAYSLCFVCSLPASFLLDLSVPLSSFPEFAFGLCFACCALVAGPMGALEHPRLPPKVEAAFQLSEVRGVRESKATEMRRFTASWLRCSPAIHWRVASSRDVLDRIHFMARLWREWCSHNLPCPHSNILAVSVLIAERAPRPQQRSLSTQGVSQQQRCSYLTSYNDERSCNIEFSAPS